jgi:threonine dehydratase
VAGDGYAGAPVDRAAIERRHALIAAHVRVTPVLDLSGADFGLAASPLALKLELVQHPGSFAVDFGAR